MKLAAIISCFFIFIISFSLKAQTLGAASATLTVTASEALPIFEGKFLAEDDDTSELIYAMLVRQATLSTIVRELKSQNLDAALFLKKLDQNFVNEFAGKEQKDLAPKVLRQRRLELLSTFGNLAQALPSFIVKEQGVSPTNPKEHFIRVSGKKDDEAIRSLYFRLMREGSEYRFNSLMLVPQLEFVNCSITDLFVETENILIDSVGTSWKKWLSEGLAKNVGEFSLGNKELEVKIANFLKERESQKNLKQTALGPEQEFASSLYLRLKLRIEKIRDNTSLGEREFIIRGEYGLLDIDSGLLMSSGSFDEKRISIFVHDKDAASNFASALYRVPLVEFATLPKKLENYNKRPQTIILDVKGVSSIQSLLSLNKFLVSQGMGMQLKSTIKSYNGQEGSLTLVYQGERESLQGVLKNIHNKKLEAGELIIYNPTQALTLELKSVGGNNP